MKFSLAQTNVLYNSAYAAMTHIPRPRMSRIQIPSLNFLKLIILLHSYFSIKINRISIDDYQSVLLVCMEAHTTEFHFSPVNFKL